MTIKDRQRYKIRPCNLNVKWISPIDKVTVHNTCALHSNLSLYSIGMNDSKYFVSEDGKRMLITPMNDITKELYEGQRIIIGNKVFKLTEIFDGDIGLRTIKMAQSDIIVGKDNFDLGIAYNEGINIVIPPTPITGYSITISGNDNVQVNTSQTYQAIVKNNNVDVTDVVIWSIDNPTNASIVPNNNSCKVTGLVEGEYIKLKCQLQKDNSVVSDKEIYISGSW